MYGRREHWAYVGVCTVWGIDYYYWIHPTLGKHRREVAEYRRETLTAFHPSKGSFPRETTLLTR